MLAITSANAITTATISKAITPAKALRSAYMYDNNINYTKNIENIVEKHFPTHLFWCSKLLGQHFLKT